MSYCGTRSAGARRLVAGAALPAALAVVFLAVLIGLGGPAAAHTALRASSPKDGGKIDVAPSQLVMEFTEPILSIGHRIVVQGPNGGQYQAGTPQITNSIKLAQPLKPLGPPGEYRVTFRVVAYDGHPLTNHMSFTLTKPGPAAGGAKAVAQPAPLAAVPSSSINNAPQWTAWTAGTVVVIAIAGAVVFGRRATHDLD